MADIALLICRLKKKKKKRKKEKKIQMDLFPKQKQTHSLREGTYTRREHSGRGIDWEFWMDMYTLLYLKQIIKKDLLYSTGNAAQYSIIT